MRIGNLVVLSSVLLAAEAQSIPAITPVRWALLAEDGCLDYFDSQPDVTVAVK
jgi:hypothetical protein